MRIGFSLEVLPAAMEMLKVFTGIAAGSRFNAIGLFLSPAHVPPWK
jgi:hypothetical protein